MSVILKTTTRLALFAVYLNIFLPKEIQALSDKDNTPLNAQEILLNITYNKTLNRLDDEKDWVKLYVQSPIVLELLIDASDIRSCDISFSMYSSTDVSTFNLVRDHKDNEVSGTCLTGEKLTRGGIPVTWGWYYIVFSIKSDYSLDLNYSFRVSKGTLPGVTEKADLRVTSISINPASGPPGSSVEVTYTIRNIGMSEATGLAKNFIHWSEDSTASDSKTFYESSYVIGLGGFISKTFTDTIRIPNDVDLGKRYYIVVETDVNKGIIEAKEDNNKAYASFDIVRGTKPDLQVSSISVSPDSAAPDSAVEVTFTVKNWGGAAAKNISVNEIFWSIYSRGVIIPDISLGLSNIGSLAVDASITNTVTITIPTNAAPNQSYYIGLRVDVNNDIEEMDENNNTLYRSFKVVPHPPGPRPDLKVSSVSVRPATGAPGSFAKVTFTIKNEGPVSALNKFACETRWSEYTFFTNYYYPLGKRTIRSLELNSSSTDTITVTVPTYVRADKRYYLGIMADADNNIDEEDETNNSDYVAFDVIPEGAQPEPQTACDFNGDGKINIIDVISLLLFLRDNPGDLRADFNGDGDADWADAVAVLLAQRNNTCPDAPTLLSAVDNSSEINLLEGLTRTDIEYIKSVLAQAGMTEEEKKALGMALYGHGQAGKPGMPKAFSLSQNFPNPFNPSATIGYGVPEGGSGQVRLRVYDIRGNLVRTLVDKIKEAGYYAVTWDGTDERGLKVSSGVYFYRMQAGGFIQTRKMVLLK
ncbi:MAG TPA: CARDB domain-containing protein [archaeon]|nr:CARDB domain-containing protein [archaeon]